MWNGIEWSGVERNGGSGKAQGAWYTVRGSSISCVEVSVMNPDVKYLSPGEGAWTGS